LPKNVKEMPKEKQEAFRRIFNEAFRYMLSKTGNVKTAETYAFRVAYSRIRNIKVNKGFIEALRDKLFKK